MIETDYFKVNYNSGRSPTINIRGILKYLTSDVVF